MRAKIKATANGKVSYHFIRGASAKSSEVWLEMPKKDISSEVIALSLLIAGFLKAFNLLYLIAVTAMVN